MRRSTIEITFDLLDKRQDSMQVLVGLDSGGMITVFPKRAMTVLTLVVFLRGSARD
jgi:hypothetical protein